MLSPKVVKAALETSHATCQGTEGCIHADALADNRDLIKADIISATMGGIEIGGPSFIPEAVYNSGFHAGYRAAQLEALDNVTAAKAA